MGLGSIRKSKNSEPGMARGSTPVGRKAGERRNGSKPAIRRAGERKSGGRLSASNKTAADIKSLARIYAPTALKELVRLSVEAQSETARVSAIDKILDRAYGPVRAIGAEREKPLEMIVGVSASLNAKLDRIANAIAAGAAQD
jgi:hypothetical protein